MLAHKCCNAYQGIIHASCATPSILMLRCTLNPNLLAPFQTFCIIPYFLASVPSLYFYECTQIIYQWKEESLSSFNSIGNIHAKKLFLIIKKLNYIPEMPIFSSCRMAQFWRCEQIRVKTACSQLHMIWLQYYCFLQNQQLPVHLLDSDPFSALTQKSALSKGTASRKLQLDVNRANIPSQVSHQLQYSLFLSDSKHSNIIQKIEPN